MQFLNQNIKYLRSLSGLTQPQLGEILGVSRDNIASYERGTVPPVEVIHKILNYFHVNFNDLIEKDFSNLDFQLVSDLEREAIKKIRSSKEDESSENNANQRDKSVEALEQIIEAQRNTIKSQQETIEALKMLIDRK